MGRREQKLGLVVEESVNGGIVLWKVQKKEARLARRRVLKGQSSASCTVYCSLASQTYFRERMRANAFTEIRLARETKSTEREEALQRRRERGFRAELTYVRTYTYVCTAAYARP